MSRILITGSAGFIGFYVAKALMEAGETVIGVDDFNPYYCPALKRARTEILTRDKRFVSLEFDVAEQRAVEDCFQKYAPEIICHMAAQAGVRVPLCKILTHTSGQTSRASSTSLSSPVCCR